MRIRFQSLHCCTSDINLEKDFEPAPRRFFFLGASLGLEKCWKVPQPCSKPHAPGLSDAHRAPGIELFPRDRPPEPQRRPPWPAHKIPALDAAKSAAEPKRTKNGCSSVQKNKPPLPIPKSPPRRPLDSVSYRDRLRAVSCFCGNGASPSTGCFRGLTMWGVTSMRIATHAATSRPPSETPDQEGEIVLEERPKTKEPRTQIPRHYARQLTSLTKPHGIRRLTEAH